jgi:hypothetical protein
MNEAKHEKKLQSKSINIIALWLSNYCVKETDCELLIEVMVWKGERENEDKRLKGSRWKIVIN